MNRMDFDNDLSMKRLPARFRNLLSVAILLNILIFYKKLVEKIE